MSLNTNTTNYKIILASQSPSRKMLLKKLNISFDVIPANINESEYPGEMPQDLVVRLAQQKAEKIYNQMFSGAINKDQIATLESDYLIIGSDQVICLNQSNDNNNYIIFGKPITHSKAVKQLSLCSNKWIDCFSGLSILHIKNNKLIDVKTHLSHSKIKYRNLSQNIIENYLKTEKPYQCAGSVQYEGLGISLFEQVESNDTNAIIGLPLIKLSSWLTSFGVNMYNHSCYSVEN